PVFLPNANGPDIFIYPTLLVLFKDRQRFGIFDLREVKSTIEFTAFVEEEGVPNDGQVVNHTWKWANKNGTPDKRFKGNYQIPVLRYGSLIFESSDGLQESYMFSNTEAFSGFAEAFAFHIKHLRAHR